MKLSEFEAIVGRSDPRTVLVFETPLDVILPHIAVMAAELHARVVRVRAPPHHSAKQKDVRSSVDYADAEPHDELEYLNLEDIFGESFNNGDWVVVDAMNAASYEAWRLVGQRLATVLPSSDYHLRKNFRLFTCVPQKTTKTARPHQRIKGPDELPQRQEDDEDEEGSNSKKHVNSAYDPSESLWLFAPPILCQFAIVVDDDGKPKYRSDVSPIFQGPTDINAAAVAGGGGGTARSGRDGGGGGGAFSTLNALTTATAASEEFGKSNPYGSMSRVRAKLIASLEAKAPATHMDYVDEMLCALREELEERQKLWVAELPEKVELLVNEEVAALQQQERLGFAPAHSAVDTAQEQALEEEEEQAIEAGLDPKSQPQPRAKARLSFAAFKEDEPWSFSRAAQAVPGSGEYSVATSGGGGGEPSSPGVAASITAATAGGGGDGSQPQQSATKLTAGRIAQMRRTRLEAERKKQEKDYDWIFPAILSWTVCHCPDADVVGIPKIALHELSFDIKNVMWANQAFRCCFGHWGGCEVAVKGMLPTYSPLLQDSLHVAFEREIGLQYSLRHPNIVAVYGVCYPEPAKQLNGPGPQGAASFLHAGGGGFEGSQSGTFSQQQQQAAAQQFPLEVLQTKVWAVLENSIGTLEQEMIRRRGDSDYLTVRAFLFILKQVLDAVSFLSVKYTHRDLACRSIMQITENVYKLSQFRCCIVKSSSQADAKDGPIPIRWTSPEGLLGLFSEKSDVWSIGVLMWELTTYCSQLPYADYPQAATAIGSGTMLTRPSECPNEIWSELIEPCFALETENRPTARQLLMRVEKCRNSWPVMLQESVIPFPDDKETFESLNSRLRGGK